jgi:hypothetical protein
MTPVRVLDTAKGSAREGAVAQTPLALALAGVAGSRGGRRARCCSTSPPSAPSATTYVTVYPTGGDRPLAANLNAVARQVVPNMVIGRLGPDGNVAIFNFAGDVDLVADVMGYFT